MTCYGKALPLPLLVDKRLLCAPSHIVLQLFTPRDHILFCGLQHSVSALGIDEHHSAKSLPDTIIIIVRGVSKTFGEWYQKTNKTEDADKLTLLVFKIIAILHNTLLSTFIKLLETVSKGLFRNRSQNRCHTFLDCRHVCKTCAFHDALQVGKQKEVHHTLLIWRPQAPDDGSTVSGLLSVSRSFMNFANSVL
jgi:hypothetical protein